MKFLINTSNLNKGGAVQVAHSFINEIKEFSQHNFFIIISSSLVSQVDVQSFSKNFVFIQYDNVPGVIKMITGNDKFLDKLEKKINPNCVFTIFGPSYWKPKSPHLVGVANGWWYNPDNPVWQKFSIYQKLVKKFKHSIQKAQVIKEGDFFVVETEDAKKRINKYLDIEFSNINVIGNTYNQIFDQFHCKNNLKVSETSSFKLITVSAFYEHKNLKIIPDVVNKLNKKGIRNIKFYLTIPQKIFEKEFEGNSSIENLGPLKVEELPSVYSQIDAVFLPTLLETFSASYPEAMKMGKPILTSELSFAKDICGNAAEYFNPLNSTDIADKIELILKNKDRREFLKCEGFKQLRKFETSKSRASKYLQICENISIK